MEKHLSFPKNKIKVLLLEKIHDAARETLAEAGYSVEVIPRAVESDELLTLVEDAHVIGVRSRTKIRSAHFAPAKRLLAIGCFSVGTDQVDLDAATQAGVPVFNAPHSSTRSVAELTLGNILMLARYAAEKSMRLHQGTWDKNISGAMEVRGKTLGVIGYGHIGQQVGLLGEAIGMEVVFYDIMKKLPLGRARAASSMNEVLQNSHFVSLHVPGSARNTNLIGKGELALMRKGSFLLNLSRGTVVDIGALKESLVSQHLGGAALDVFPEEPIPSVSPFQSEMCGVPNVILTPHIGGNTEEAQRNIGIEVALALQGFIDHGQSNGAVNFPQVGLPQLPATHRILHVHQNVPGVLAGINQIVSQVGANIEAQQLGTYKEIGYLVMDINRELSEEVKRRISEMPTCVRTRILY